MPPPWRRGAPGSPGGRERRGRESGRAFTPISWGRAPRRGGALQLAEDLVYLFVCTALVGLIVAANLGARHTPWRAAVLFAAGFGACVYALLGLTFLLPGAGGSTGGDFLTGAIRLAGAAAGVWFLAPAIARLFRDGGEAAAARIPAETELPAAETGAPDVPRARSSAWGRALFGAAGVWGGGRSTVTTVTLAFWAVVLSYLVSLQVGQGLLQQLSSQPSSVSPVDLLVQELPYLVAALFGVGWLTRRPLVSTLGRLGLSRPTPRQAALLAPVAAGAIVLLLVMGLGFDNLLNRTSPVTAREITRVSSQLFREFTGVPSAALLAVASGVSEEAFFRGALQPRLGIVPTAAMFAVVHVQYGFDLVTLEVFCLAVVLGLLRLRFGLLASMTTHAGYNFVVSLLPG